VTVVTTRRGVSVVAIALVLLVRTPLVVRISAGMAVNAGECRVVRRDQVAVRTDRAIMRNAEPGVIKGSPQPARSHPGGVAGYAGCWIQRGNVVRHGAAQRLRTQPGRLMASIAIRVRRSKGERIGADVARSAGRGDVRSLQRPARGAVIELAIHPQQRVVAGRAL